LKKELFLDLTTK